MDDIHWGTVATSLLASVLGSGVTVFVLEYLFGWKLKAKIEIQVARQIAELSRVHERRLELISDLGGKLFNLRAAFVEYTAPMRGDDSPDLQTSRLSLNKAIREFDASLQPRRCFIPSATLAKLEAFREEARDIAWAFANFVESTEDGRLAPEQVREKHKTWEAARAFVVDRSKALLADLHQDFQLILGIAEPPAAAASLPARSDSPTG